MAAAPTFFVHRVYTGKLGDSHGAPGSSRAELSSLVGGDKDSDVSDGDNVRVPAAKGKVAAAKGAECNPVALRLFVH